MRCFINVVTMYVTFTEEVSHEICRQLGSISSLLMALLLRLQEIMLGSMLGLVLFLEQLSLLR